MFHALAHFCQNRLILEGDLRDQDHIRAARHACMESNEASVTPHQFKYHDTMMRLGSGTQLINCFGSGRDSSIKPEGHLRTADIVINCLRDTNDRDTFLI